MQYFYPIPGRISGKLRQSRLPRYPGARKTEQGYTVAVLKLDRAALDYAAFYCEENVWRLLARPELAEVQAWAVLVSSARREVVLLRQRAGRIGDGLIHWDYHAFAVAVDPLQGRMALDLDSDLPFPCPLARYLEDSFPRDVQRAFGPRFRVVPAADYVKGLVSDRSHMRRPDGSWLAPPPPWPAPGSDTGRPSVLMDWVDMGTRSPGTVFDRRRMESFASETVRA